ncbi:MAG TPA: hypothetical protein VJB02_03270 [Coxiellaceae bacterium]|nr:hypothetical protein [Coxiellaceae bacterium]
MKAPFSLLMTGAIIASYLTSAPSLGQPPANVVSMWNTNTMHCWTTTDGATHCEPRASTPAAPVVGDSWNTPTSHCWIDPAGAKQCVPRTYPNPPPGVVSSWNTPTMHCWVDSTTGTHCQPRRW